MDKPLLPWQRHVADVAMEIDDTGRFIYDETDLLVPRQSGKTLLTAAKTVNRLVVMAHTMGPQNSTYTAQRRQDARKKLERDFAKTLRSSKHFTETSHARQRPRGSTEWRLQLNNGSECIEFGNGSFWTIDAPGPNSIHGDTLDDGTIDEAFAHQDSELEGAMGPAMLTRTNAQLWVVSTAGNKESAYLWRKVVAGRDACETGLHGSVAYFEWSAPFDWEGPDDDRLGDPAVWASCSPALGHTIDVEKLHKEWAKAQRRGDAGIREFARYYLNLWPEVPVLDEDATRDQVLPAEEWDLCCDPEAVMSDPVTFALDITPDRASASICAAGAGEGLTILEVVDHRPGTRWLVPRLVQLLGTHANATVVLDKAGAARSLIPDLESAGITPTVASMADHADACSQLYDDVVAGAVRHLGQPLLEAAVDGATKRTAGSGGLWLWDRLSGSVDISPLVAVTLARWGHVRAAAAPPPKRSGYYSST